jgi:hypothetical protein
MVGMSVPVLPPVVANEPDDVRRVFGFSFALEEEEETSTMDGFGEWWCAGRGGRWVRVNEDKAGHRLYLYLYCSMRRYRLRASSRPPLTGPQPLWSVKQGTYPRSTHTLSPTPASPNPSTRTCTPSPPPNPPTLHPPPHFLVYRVANGAQA